MHSPRTSSDWSLLRHAVPVAQPDAVAAVIADAALTITEGEER